MAGSRLVDAIFRRRIDKIFLLHIWLCVPFSRLWDLWDRSQRPLAGYRTLRALAFVATLYLIGRGWVVFRSRDPAPWRSVWPVFDVTLVTAIIATMAEPTGPFALMYMVPIAYAAFTLTLPATIAVGVLSGIGLFSAGVVSGGWHTHEAPSVAFRSLFPVLMASLMGFVGREASRLRERLALSEYQRDLAAEMHDGIQHDLVLIARRLDLADALRQTDPARAAEMAVEQRDTARRASEEIRTMVRGLRAGATPGQGFSHRMREHLESIATGSGVEVAFSEASDDDVPPRCQHAILRIVQEAVTNALKHSGARRIEVGLEVGRDRCVATVRDDGNGFEAKTAPAGVGLDTMRTRAAALGGECRVESEPGTGTIVTLTLPTRSKDRRMTLRGTHQDRGH